MADLDLPALRALCERATPGPWRTASLNMYHHSFQAVVEAESDIRAGYVMGLAESTAAFIAAARTALPALLEECERMRKERDEALEKSERNYEPIKAWIAKYPDRAMNHMWAAMWKAEEERDALKVERDQFAISENKLATEVSIQSARAQAAETRATLAREAGFREGVEAAAKHVERTGGTACAAYFAAGIRYLLPPPPTTPASGNEKKED